MKKQVVGIFVCMVLIASFLPIVSSTDKNDIAQSTNKIFVDDGTDIDDCRSCGSNSDYGHTFMKPDLETLQKWLEDYNNAPKAFIDPEIELLDSKNLLPRLDYIPSQRNQGSCGNCWAWAGTGVLGIALDVQEGTHDRLSVQYMNSCDIRNSCCRGGNLWLFTNFYAMTGKAIPWSNTNAHWQDDDGTCHTSCESISTTPNYPISSIEYTTITTHKVDQSTAISNIKNVLNQNKAIFFGFYMPDDASKENFIDFWDYRSENTIWNADFSCGHTWINGVGHAVLCVGYNDDAGTNNDYWIMLNSWGTTSDRPNGLFRLDMNIDYGCTYYNGGTYFPSYFWQTINVNFGPGGNKPPNTPSRPSGPGSREVGISGTYSTSAIDPDGDQVQYQFDWGDGSRSDWTPLDTSGHSAFLSHSWGRSGTYTVKAQAKDKHGAPSSWWSSGKTVYVPGGDEDNDPPYKPTKPSGPSSGQNWKSYAYSTSTTDPDGDQLYYQWNWGGGIYSFWLGPFNSGETANALHTWIIGGSRQIRVKAIDDPNGDGNLSDGTESEWSDPLSVTMPKNKATNNPLFLQFLENFLQQHPILYQLLQRFLRL